MGLLAIIVIMLGSRNATRIRTQILLGGIVVVTTWDIRDLSGQPRFPDAGGSAVPALLTGILFPFTDTPEQLVEGTLPLSFHDPHNISSLILASSRQLPVCRA
jgi:hypothetical protein